jgi:hypothetical protein
VVFEFSDPGAYETADVIIKEGGGKDDPKKTSYEVALPGEFHVSIGERETPLAPLAGDVKNGAGRAIPSIAVSVELILAAPPPDTVAVFTTLPVAPDAISTMMVIAG